MNDQPNKKFRKPPTSIDGISLGRTTGARAGGSIDFKRPNSYRPQNQAKSQGQRIGDFKSPDGFRQAQNPLIEMPKRPKYERPATKKQSKFSIFKKKKNDRLDGVDYYEKRKAKRRKRLKIAAIVILIIALIVGFLFAKGYLNLRKVLSGGGGAAALQENVDPSRLRGEGDGRINILLLGRGGEGHEGADLTDTIVLVSIDPIAKEAGLVSIPRDLYVKVPGEGSMKINSVFYTGKSSVLNKSKNPNDQTKKDAENAGFDLLENTVEETLGIPVHYHAMVDFTGFKQAIDTVGGIDMNVPKAVYEPMRIDGKPYTLNVKPGQKHFGGFEALAYARSRHTSARGDFDRSERQRLIISATKDKVFSLGTFSNPAKISQLLDNFGDHVQTNFSIQDLNRLYEITRGIESSKIVSIGLADPPNDYVKTANIGGLSVVIPKAGVGNYKDIQFYIRNTLKDSFLKMENPSVMILNGTSRSGIATEKADELKSYGYNVISVDNAPSLNYSNTVLVDMRGGEKKYTKRYLELRFKTLAITSLPDNSIQPGYADFVIILGGDTSSQSAGASCTNNNCDTVRSPHL